MLKKVQIWGIVGSFFLLNISFRPISKIEQKEEFKLTVMVKGISKIQGNILLALYNSETTFLKERYKSSITKVTQETAQIVFEYIEKGTYGVAIFQDLNKNNELDTNILGVPKEPYGFSNNASGHFSAPNFSDVQFKMQTDKIITINL